MCRNQTQFHIHYLQKWTVRHLFHYCKNNKSLISLYMIRVVKQTWIISRLLKHYKLAHLLVVLPFKNENWNCSTCLGTRYWIIKESSCIISSNLHNLTSYKKYLIYVIHNILCYTIITWYFEVIHKLFLYLGLAYLQGWEDV